MAKNNAIAVTSIIAGVILIIALLALFVFKPVNSSSGNTVTVQGISDVKVMPDLVTVYFTIEKREIQVLKQQKRITKFMMI